MKKRKKQDRRAKRSPQQGQDVSKKPGAQKGQRSTRELLAAFVDPRQQPDAGDGCFPTQKLPPKWPKPPSFTRQPHKTPTPNRRGR